MDESRFHRSRNHMAGEGRRTSAHTVSHAMITLLKTPYLLLTRNSQDFALNARQVRRTVQASRLAVTIPLHPYLL